MLTALTHYRRAEVSRSLAWRERLDRTTNRAVGATAAFLGFGFSRLEMTYAFFLFGLAIVYFLLYVEARRYRFYGAYESLRFNNRDGNIPAFPVHLIFG